MGITRRVLAILVVVATLFLAAPAPAKADGCDGICRERLVQVGLRGKVVQLVADGDSTCALTEAGDVYCWGAGAGPDNPKPALTERNKAPLTVIHPHIRPKSRCVTYCAAANPCIPCMHGNISPDRHASFRSASETGL